MESGFEDYFDYSAWSSGPHGDDDHALFLDLLQEPLPGNAAGPGNVVGLGSTPDGVQHDSAVESNEPDSWNEGLTSGFEADYCDWWSGHGFMDFEGQYAPLREDSLGPLGDFASGFGHDGGESAVALNDSIWNAAMAARPYCLATNDADEMRASPAGLHQVGQFDFQSPFEPSVAPMETCWSDALRSDWRPPEETVLSSSSCLSWLSGPGTGPVSLEMVNNSRSRNSQASANGPVLSRRSSENEMAGQRPSKRTKISSVPGHMCFAFALPGASSSKKVSTAAARRPRQAAINQLRKIRACFRCRMLKLQVRRLSPSSHLQR